MLSRSASGLTPPPLCFTTYQPGTIGRFRPVGTHPAATISHTLFPLTQHTQLLLNDGCLSSEFYSVRFFVAL